MVKLGCWIMAIILLCTWCWGGYGIDSMPEHSTVGVHEKNAGKIAFFLLYVVVCEIGKKLDKGYGCPVYCDITHKHYYWENDEKAKGNIQTDDGISRPDELKDREQSEGSVRPIASTD